MDNPPRRWRGSSQTTSDCLESSARRARRRMQPPDGLCKSWAFCASFASIASLASTCAHPAGSRKSIAGLKQGGTYVSALTAEYPASHAEALASLMQPFCASTGKHAIRISEFANLLPEPVVHRRPPVAMGLRSTADHTNPSKSSPLGDIAQHWQAYVTQRSITPDLVSHLGQSIDSHPHPPSPQQQLDVAEITHQCLRPSCNSGDCLAISPISPGQPFRVSNSCKPSPSPRASKTRTATWALSCSKAYLPESCSHTPLTHAMAATPAEPSGRRPA